MKKVIFIYRSGGKPGQQTEEEKRKAGLDYIEKLKADGEKVIEVKEENKQFLILIEE